MKKRDPLENSETYGYQLAGLFVQKNRVGGSMGFILTLLVCLATLPVYGGDARPDLEFWKKHPLEYEVIVDRKPVLVPVLPEFKKRREDEECRKKYKDWEDKYLSADAKLAKLIKEKADKKEIKAATEAADFAREKYFQVMQLGDTHCGDCLTPDVRVRKVDEGLVPEIWYESHGFCTLESITEKAIEAGYNNATEFLRSPQKYLNRNGGFRAILEFLPYDDKTKEPLKKFGTAKDGEFHGFMAVRANIMNAGYVAFSYYIKNLVTSKETEATKYFDLVFEQAEKGPKFDAPEIYDVTTTGEKKAPLIEMKLQRILGWWYVDTDKGLFRYSTAAQFPVALDHAKTEARRTHLDTIATLRAKFFSTIPENRAKEPEKE
ncbi:MAG: hypothetical protein R3B54_14500 [Bdellovibrionota bacterium]